MTNRIRLAGICATDDTVALGAPTCSSCIRRSCDAVGRCWLVAVVPSRRSAAFCRRDGQSRSRRAKRSVLDSISNNLRGLFLVLNNMYYFVSNSVKAVYPIDSHFGPFPTAPRPTASSVATCARPACPSTVCAWSANRWSPTSATAGLTEPRRAAH